MVRRSIRGESVAGVLNRLLARLRRQGSRLFDFELGDHLRLAFVEDLEILLAKIPDGVSLGVANHCAHHHQLYIHFERGRFVVRSEFLRVLLTLGLLSGASGSASGGSRLGTTLAEDDRRAN